MVIDAVVLPALLHPAIMYKCFTMLAKIGILIDASKHFDMFYHEKSLSEDQKITKKGILCRLLFKCVFSWTL
jgi:hypothetical protein